MKSANGTNQFSNQKSIKWDVYLFILFIALLLSYAYFNDWVYDEATSYNGVLNNSLWDLLTYNKFKLANNHLLNSLYFRLLQSWHVTNVVYYRLLGILGFALFFRANSKILKLLKINYAYIIFLLVAPFFCYFTLGRGYALAIGCFSMALLYLLKYIQESKVRYAYLLVIFGAVSSLSIFSFLYGFLALLGVLYLFEIKQKRLINIHNLLLFIIVVPLMGYVYYLGKIVNAYDISIIGVKTLSPLKYGTISSIFSDFSYRDEWIRMFFDNGKILSIVKYLKIIVTLCLLIPMFYGVATRYFKVDLAKTKTILVLLILLPFGVMICAHVAAHALYPMTRAVFYLHYLVLLLVLYATITYAKKAIWYIPMAIIFLSSFFYNAYAFYDLSRPSTKEMLAKTSNGPLFLVTKSDPKFMLIDSLYGVNQKNIIADSVMLEAVPKIQNDSSRVRWILCWPEYKDSALHYFPNSRVYRCREGNSLIGIAR